MVNIVMVTRNRYRLLQQSLDSLYANTPHSLFNLTLVDDCSDDFRAERAYRQYSSRYNCNVVRISRSTHVLASLKNLAVLASEITFGTGEWLYISDNDVYFKLHWLEMLTSLAQDTEPNNFALWGGQVHHFHQPLHINKDWTEQEVLDGPSWLMRWPTWDKFGPLEGNGRPGSCCEEDRLFCADLRSVGLRIGVTTPHVVLHTGLIQTEGTTAPGADSRIQEAGVYYG